MKSTGEKIKELTDFAIHNSANLSVWEFDFLNSIENRTDNGVRTTFLSGKQVEIIDKIYKKVIGE